MEMHHSSFHAGIPDRNRTCISSKGFRETLEALIYKGLALSAFLGLIGVILSCILSLAFLERSKCRNRTRALHFSPYGLPLETS
jgi:hypothetical protein